MRRHTVYDVEGAVVAPDDVSGLGDWPERTHELPLFLEVVYALGNLLWAHHP